ncbi:MAG: IPT/TIG domain-containing protein, partial [Myxococcota bacterium]|nr:IPT/TIG domain-containing protein [Myxococcota bacterium]
MPFSKRSLPPIEPRFGLWALLLCLGFAFACEEEPKVNTDLGDAEADFVQDTEQDLDITSDAELHEADQQEQGPNDFELHEEDFDTPDLNEQSTPLRLLSVTPNRSASSGNRLVTLGGEGLRASTEVFFGSAAVLQRELIDQYTMQVVVPPGRAGKVSIHLRDGAQSDTLPDAFEYIDAVSVQQLDVPRSATTGGVPFSLGGTAFEPSCTLSICGRGVFDLQYQSDTELTGITPPCSAGPATLRLGCTQGTLELEDAVEYYEALQVTQLFPIAGPTRGGTRVTIQGQGFGPGLQVLFGNKPALLEQWSANHAVLLSPPQSAGARDLSVSLDGQSSSLKDAFHYLDSSSQLRLLAVFPKHGQSGSLLALAGEGFDAGVSTVRIGGQEASIERLEPNSILVRAPTAEPGLVTISVHNQLGSAELLDAWRYDATLAVDSIEPRLGPSAGGSLIRIEGQGFEPQMQVFFGPLAATSVNVLDEHTLELLSPAASAGVVDLLLRSAERELRVENAFRFEDPLSIQSFTPQQGSQSGNTLITVSGYGFDENTTLELDGVPMLGLEWLDPYTMRARSPAHAVGEVVLQARSGSVTQSAPSLYTYFDPSTMYSGAWGGPIAGNLNVSVKTRGSGAPVEAATVRLGYSNPSSWSGLTDANGQLCLSGVGLSGAQVVTASKEGYSSTTITDVDAENLTIFIAKNGEEGESNPPKEIVPGIIYGHISGGEKVSLDAGLGKTRMAIVLTSQADVYSPNPEPGEANQVSGPSGDYELLSRFGDVAVIGLCGIYDNITGTFEPKLLAMQRFLFVTEGSTQRVDLVCSVPLDLTMRYKLLDAPFDEGLSQSSVRAYLQIGPEGVFGAFSTANSDTDTVVIPNQLPLTGAFANMDYSVIAGVYSSTGLPYTYVQADGLRNFSQTVELGPMLGVPLLKSPGPGGTLV